MRDLIMFLGFQGSVLVLVLSIALPLYVNRRLLAVNLKKYLYRNVLYSIVIFLVHQALLKLLLFFDIYILGNDSFSKIYSPDEALYFLEMFIFFILFMSIVSFVLYSRKKGDEKSPPEIFDHSNKLLKFSKYLAVTVLVFQLVPSYWMIILVIWAYSDFVNSLFEPLNYFILLFMYLIPISFSVLSIRYSKYFYSINNRKRILSRILFVANIIIFSFLVYFFVSIGIVLPPMFD